jgi:hypothetical protein
MILGFNPILSDRNPVETRMALARHLSAITMRPVGKTYVASGSWDLIGTPRMDGAEGQNRTAYAGLFRAALYR